MDWQAILSGLGAGNTGVSQMLQKFGGGIAGNLSGYGDDIKDGAQGLFGGLAGKFGNIFGGGDSATPTVPGSMVGQVINRTDVPQVAPGQVADKFSIPPLQYATDAATATPAPNPAALSAADASARDAKIGTGLASLSGALGKAAQPQAQAPAPQPMPPMGVAPAQLHGGNQSLAAMGPPQLQAPVNLQQYLMMLRGGRM